MGKNGDNRIGTYVCLSQVHVAGISKPVWEDREIDLDLDVTRELAFTIAKRYTKLGHKLGEWKYPNYDAQLGKVRI